MMQATTTFSKRGNSSVELYPFVPRLFLRRVKGDMQRFFTILMKSSF